LFRFQSAKAKQIKKLKKGSTVIITDSPYKNDLETAKESDKSLAGIKQLFGGKNPKKTQAPKRMKPPLKKTKAVVTMMTRNMQNVFIATVCFLHPRKERVG
jgi:adenine-specific DNA methylase